MGSPSLHAEQSAKRFGGVPQDYIEIHELMDSSKKAFSDLRHRALTHNSWFVTEILEKIFGRTIKNSAGVKVAVRDIGQWHVMEDFGGSFPTAQDYLTNFKLEPWMDNGANDSVPPSHVGLPKFNKSLLTPKPFVTPKKETPPRVFRPSGGCGGGGRFD
jgi:hypothetical protein